MRFQCCKDEMVVRIGLSAIGHLILGSFPAISTKQYFSLYKPRYIQRMETFLSLKARKDGCVMFMYSMAGRMENWIYSLSNSDLPQLLLRHQLEGPHFVEYLFLLE